MKKDRLCGTYSKLIGLNNINLILGRNGTGKSRFLRDLNERLSKNKKEFYTRYVSPERSGWFICNDSDKPITLQVGAFPSADRNSNQPRDFKQEAAGLLRDLELLYWRRLAREAELTESSTSDIRGFQKDRLEKINNLLTNIELQLTDTSYVFCHVDSGKPIAAENISSGEAEVVTLAVEILFFLIL